MENSRILIIEEERLTTYALAENLRLHPNYAVICFKDVWNATDFASWKHANIILIPHAPPGIDATEVIANIRDRGVHCPLIVISAYASEAEIVRILDAGAADYVTVPFNFSVLHARLRSQLRVFEESENAMLCIGSSVLYMQKRMMINLNSSKEVRLTEKEALLLRALYRAGATPVSKAKIMTDVWGYCMEADSHTLETHIHRLRRKLQQIDEYHDTVITEPSGYRLGNIS